VKRSTYRTFTRGIGSARATVLTAIFALCLTDSLPAQRDAGSTPPAAGRTSAATDFEIPVSPAVKRERAMEVWKRALDHADTLPAVRSSRGLIGSNTAATIAYETAVPPYIVPSTKRQEVIRAYFEAQHDALRRQEAWKAMSDEDRWTVASMAVLPESELARLSRLRPAVDPGRAGKAERMANSLNMSLVGIPLGTFQMGEAFDTSKSEPQHEVSISIPLFVGAHEVTQAQYEKVMGSNPSAFCAGGDRAADVEDVETASLPVENVRWYNAVEFCRRLSAMPAEKEQGRVYRLPTEAEWEYACRGGTTTDFHFGNIDGVRGDEANWNASKLGKRPLQRPAPVGSYDPNAFGLYDMHGNVAEWCADWYDDGYYKRSPNQDPPGPSLDSLPTEGPKSGGDVGRANMPAKVVRGGGWNGKPDRISYFSAALSSARRSMDPEKGLAGFRVVCELAPVSDLAQQQFAQLDAYADGALDRAGQNVRQAHRERLEKAYDEKTQELEDGPSKSGFDDLSRSLIYGDRADLMIDVARSWEEDADQDKARAAYIQAAKEFSLEIDAGERHDRSRGDKPSGRYYDRARIYMKLERFEEAAADFTRAIEQQPLDVFYGDRANAYKALGQHREAISDYSRFIDYFMDIYRKDRQNAKPGSRPRRYRYLVEALANRAECYDALGEETNAKEDKETITRVTEGRPLAE